jgi:hypothetical protein
MPKGVPIGRRSPLRRGPSSTPIHTNQPLLKSADRSPALRTENAVRRAGVEPEFLESRLHRSPITPIEPKRGFRGGQLGE